MKWGRRGGERSLRFLGFWSGGVNVRISFFFFSFNLFFSCFLFSLTSIFGILEGSERRYRVFCIVRFLVRN